jgi:hypothetical protein
LSSLRFVRLLGCSICAASLPPRSELPPLSIPDPVPERAPGLLRRSSHPGRFPLFVISRSLCEF